MVYYLYVKTHNNTGLKYLGQTIRNPFKYRGSGKYWKDHLKAHGNDITTEIIGQYDTLNALTQAGLYYSKLWDIDRSDRWANLIPEGGTGIPPNASLNRQPRPNMRGKRKGMIACKDLNGNTFIVSREVFDDRPDLVGVNKGVKLPGVSIYRKNAHNSHSVATKDKMRNAAKERWSYNKALTLDQFRQLVVI